ncbi:uncharacterized protein LOC104876657 [Fukomys damarensis]|uniref:uncharacterized protein LOC104876657 n=1 Tax=Fukomys damarensis TaxID=885580 RepID=UPI00145556E3|nr:uncharacterized protein LOC104876657 [Fukomys damarensis]
MDGKASLGLGTLFQERLRGQIAASPPPTCLRLPANTSPLSEAPPLLSLGPSHHLGAPRGPASRACLPPLLARRTFAGAQAREDGRTLTLASVALKPRTWLWGKQGSLGFSGAEHFGSFQTPDAPTGSHLTRLSTPQGKARFAAVRTPPQTDPEPAPPSSRAIRQRGLPGSSPDPDLRGEQIHVTSRPPSTSSLKQKQRPCVVCGDDQGRMCNSLRTFKNKDSFWTTVLQRIKKESGS